LIFFAFAGYARIATLGEEVLDPQRTIPRAIPIALGIVLVVYVLVALTCLRVLGVAKLASSTAPLADVASGELSNVVRVGAAVAVCGVLLSLIAGIGRTTLAMARRHDLPHVLANVHASWRTPWIAELAVAAVVIAVVALADVRHAIGFSSLTVLVYYAIANLSAWTLSETLDGTRIVAALGFAGCLALAVTLPVASVVTGAAVLLVGAAAYLIRQRLAGSARP
jgi:APA family basic amino acid/polyamine antiporter